MISPDTLLTSYQWVISQCKSVPLFRSNPRFINNLQPNIFLKRRWLARPAILRWKWSRQLHGHALQSRREVAAPLLLFKRQWSGGEWLKEEDARCSFETVKQSIACLIGAELLTWPSRESKCPPDVFQRPKNRQFLQFSLLQFASLSISMCQ